jgi:hypothetical protein
MPLPAVTLPPPRWCLPVRAGAGTVSIIPWPPESRPITLGRAIRGATRGAHAATGHPAGSHREQLAALVTLEVGKRTAECLAEIDKSAQLIRYYAELAPTLLAPQSIPTQASQSGVAFERWVAYWP